jgi:3-deoxy-D-arabino-heptulosonate 7-phosphate (DAHP) synthase
LADRERVRALVASEAWNGGQYAKPRSAPFETHAGKTFMTFRGPIVHAPKADERHRAGNAHRIATRWIASEIITPTLRKTPAPGFAADRIWTSHEALLFDYEAPQIREYRDRRYLTSTATPSPTVRTSRPGSWRTYSLKRQSSPLFSSIVRAYGVSPGGIHLETTVDDVDECVWDRDALIDPHRYTTGCDPRLSLIQAQHVIEKWVAA